MVAEELVAARGGGVRLMADATTQSPVNIPTPEELGFDPEALRKKYAAERARRLRADANDQYQMIAGRFDHYNVDPTSIPGSRGRPGTRTSTCSSSAVAFMD